jgi:succinylglutamate desuccinylase
MYEQNHLTKLLESFNKHSNSEEYQWHFHHDGGAIDFQLQVCSIIHGNEVGSLPAIIRILNELRDSTIQFGGRLSIVLGNPEAALENKRFLESDLNRMFLQTTLDTHESRRAQQLMPILSKCDLLLDLHQTILSSVQSFFIFPWSTDSGLWARALGSCNAYVDATPSLSTAPTTKCADEFIWEQKKPAVTIELGQKGFYEQAEELAYISITSAMKSIEQIHNGHSLESLSKKQQPLKRFKTIHREPFHSADLQLRDGLVNFMPIKKGQSLQAEGTPQLKVPVSGMLLFPKYPQRKNGIMTERKPKEIYRIIKQV